MLVANFLIIFKLTCFLIGFIPLTVGKYYDRCELAKELLNTYQFPEDELGDWICLVDAESSFNTAALSSVTYDYVRDYGLFQVSFFGFIYLFYFLDCLCLNFVFVFNSFFLILAPFR